MLRQPLFRVFSESSIHERFITCSSILRRVSDLLKHAKAMGLSNARAQIAADNTVSLHLLRRAGFKVNGWDKPANLRRGSIDCLLLSRSLRPAVGVVLTGSHVHLSA